MYRGEFVEGRRCIGEEMWEEVYRGRRCIGEDVYRGGGV